mmetsp:Transcript_45584/g.98732  ORF Transcript_45584/g.98732 Transcript_45584/m.98732 type:complete len:208 (+) Transcript_45584:1264-1887(+)
MCTQPHNRHTRSPRRCHVRPNTSADPRCVHRHRLRLAPCLLHTAHHHRPTQTPSPDPTTHHAALRRPHTRLRRRGHQLDFRAWSRLPYTPSHNRHTRRARQTPVRPHHPAHSDRVRRRYSALTPNRSHNRRHTRRTHPRHTPTHLHRQPCVRHPAVAHPTRRHKPSLHASPRSSHTHTHPNNRHTRRPCRRLVHRHLTAHHRHVRAQ